MHDKSIIFIDDSPTQHFIFTQGYFNTHPIKDFASLKAYCVNPENNDIPAEQKVFRLLEDLESGMPIDYAVVDYHMPGTDGRTMRSIIKHKYPDCIMWMYTGMPYRHIEDIDKATFDRIINKDNGVSYLLDCLLEDIKS